MAYVNLTGLAAVLKYLYRPLVDTISNMRVLLDLVEKRTSGYNVKGYQMWQPLHAGRNRGVGSVIAEAALPTATGQTYIKSLWNAIYSYGSIALNGQALRLATGGSGSAINTLKEEVTGIAEDLAQEKNRMYWHDGSSVLTQCLANAGNNLDVESTKFLSVGDAIDVRLGTDGTLLVTTIVTAIVSSIAATVTAACTTESALYFVTRKNARNAASWGSAVEAWGLEALVREATNPTTAGLTDYVGGLDRTAAANTAFRSKIFANGAVLRDLTPGLMQQAFDELLKYSGQRLTSKNAVILTNYELQRMYGTYLTADRRFVSSGGRMTLDGGWEGLDFNGVAVIADPDASLTATPQYLRRMYFIHLPQLEEFVPVDWTWLNEEQGGPKIDWVQGYDAYVASLGSYHNLTIKNPKACCVLSDLKES